MTNKLSKSKQHNASFNPNDGECVAQIKEANVLKFLKTAKQIMDPQAALSYDS